MSNHEIVGYVETKSHVEHIGAEGVAGWLYAVQNHNYRLTVEVIVDDVPAAKVVADKFRPDILALGIGDGCCGFRMQFPDEFFDGVTHAVMLRVVDSGENLFEDPVPILFPEKPFPKKILGNFEQIDRDMNASGWASSEDGEAVFVELMVNGVEIDKRLANLVRPDLIVRRIASGRAGFKVQIPWKAVDRLENEINVSVRGRALQGSPKRLDLSPLIKILVEGVRHGKVFFRMQGWQGTPLSARVYVDGQIAGSTQFRAVRNEFGEKQPHYSAEWEIPAVLRDGQPHVYCCEIRETKAVVRSDAALLKFPDYKVFIDHADYESISGWAFRDDQLKPLVLEVHSNGRLVGLFETLIDRPDVVSKYGRGSANVGFQIALPHDVLEKEVTIMLRDSETKIVVAEVSTAAKYNVLADMATNLRRNSVGLNQAKLRSVLAPLTNAVETETSFSFVALPKVRGDISDTAVDIVIPVYAGSIETAECIQSVLEARNEVTSRIILVNDCSPDPLICELLETIEKRQRPDLIVVHRTKNGGFSESVNIGMTIAGNRHVVLLNSDTVVQHGWLDRLVAVALRDPTIGTVTPMSNNGEIVTLPYQCKSLAVKEAELARKIDNLSEQHNSGVDLDLPVAVGFCMFIRRQCIDDIGLFDADLWGRGYGEEVDFCLKARACGWRHVVAANVFVVHRGSVSFGNEKLERIKESARKINERYPFYEQLIQRFILWDPLASARRRVNISLISDILSSGRVLHVSHQYGGGTDKYVRDLSAIQVQSGQVPLVLRFDSNGAAALEVRLEHSDLAGLFEERHIEIYKKDEIAELQADIRRLQISAVHVHSPFGMSVDFLEWLTSEFAVNTTIHDYAWICPRVTLTQSMGEYCGEPDVQECDACVATHGAHPGLRSTFVNCNSSVAEYRQVMSKLLARSEKIFVGVNDVVQRLERYGIDGRFNVTPHPEVAPEMAALEPIGSGRRSGAVRVALFGAISDIKGFYKLSACVRYAEDNRLPLSFIVFGYTMNDSEIEKFRSVTITGPYDENHLYTLVRNYCPDVGLFPYQCPETYSYTLSHCLHLGVWPIVSDLGAPAERVRALGFGEVLPHDASAAVICQRLLAAGQRARRTGPTVATDNILLGSQANKGSGEL